MLENQDGNMIWERKQHAIQQGECKVMCMTGIICSTNIKEKQVSQVVFLERRTVRVDKVRNKAISGHANNADLIPGYRLGRFLAGYLT